MLSCSVSGNECNQIKVQLFMAILGDTGKKSNDVGWRALRLMCHMRKCKDCKELQWFLSFWSSEFELWMSMGMQLQKTEASLKLSKTELTGRKKVSNHLMDLFIYLFYGAGRGRRWRSCRWLSYQNGRSVQSTSKEHIPRTEQQQRIREACDKLKAGLYISNIYMLIIINNTIVYTVPAFGQRHNNCKKCYCFTNT